MNEDIVILKAEEIATMVDGRIVAACLIGFALVCISTLITDYRKRKLIKEWQKVAKEMGEQE